MAFCIAVFVVETGTWHSNNLKMEEKKKEMEDNVSSDIGFHSLMTAQQNAFSYSVKLCAE